MPYSTEFLLALEIGPAYPRSALANPDRFRERPSRGPNQDPLYLLRHRHKIPCHFPPAVNDTKDKAETTVY